jgi:hypothetical protein
VKVGRFTPATPPLLGRLALVSAIAVAIMLGSMPAGASAITRPQVLNRANSWIKKHVRYSQSAYYGGYRRDCSGFVSMAWKLKTSYTSSTIRSKAKKISWRTLKPGDAVRRTGHVEIFGGWKNRSKRIYVALEESTWGKPALRHAKAFKSGYSALRYRGIVNPTPNKPTKPKPIPTPITPPVTPPVIPPGVPGTDATASPSPTLSPAATVAATANETRRLAF